MSRLKLNIRIPSIHRINTCIKNTLKKIGVEIIKVEDKEEVLVMEEAKSYVIIVDNQEILTGTVVSLKIHVLIANPFIIMSNSVHN